MPVVLEGHVGSVERRPVWLAARAGAGAEEVGQAGRVSRVSLF